MKILNRLIPIVIMTLIPCVADAQQPEAKQKANTKLEVFMSRVGGIIVKESHELGRLHDTIVGTLILYEPGQEAEREKGLKIEVLGGRGRESICFLDIEEIVELKRALDYMLKVEEKWKGERRDYTEVIFTTKGNLRTGFYLDKGKTTAFVECGSVAPIGDVLPGGLKSLRALVVKGQQFLETS